MSHHHFSTTERSEIAILLKKSYSHHDIANTLGCSQSSVSREIRRNSVHGIYEPRKAKQKARFTRLQRIPNLKPTTNAAALMKMGNTIKHLTITHDNGIENKNHEDVAKALSVQTFFCNPYSSWEKGSVENTIGRIRRFISKGADLNDYSDEEIAAIEHWLNHTPRKCLGYKTPYEVMLVHNLLRSSYFTSPK